MNETPQPSARDMRAKELDWRALADALDREGKHELAEEMRRSGESAELKSKQAVNLSNEQFMAQRQKELDQEVEAASNIPRPAHDPRFAARKLDFDTAALNAAIKAVKNVLKPANQNNASSRSNPAKGPTPSSGK